MSMDARLLHQLLIDLTSHEEFKRRITLCQLGLRKHGLDSETRGILIGRLEELDWLRDVLPNLIFPPPSETSIPDDVTDLPTGDAETGRVAPPQRIPWWQRS